MEVRDILLDAESFGGDTGNEGAVFIDFVPDDATGVVTAAIGTYEDYGPKNEVYLDAGQAIYFKVTNAEKIAIGLKAPSGATEATVTNADSVSKISIGSASDQYYTINPADGGSIMIQNTGSALLSVTKLKTSGDAEISLSLDQEIMMAYVAK